MPYQHRLGGNPLLEGWLTWLACGDRNRKSVEQSRQWGRLCHHGVFLPNQKGLNFHWMGHSLIPLKVSGKKETLITNHPKACGSSSCQVYCAGSCRGSTTSTLCLRLHGQRASPHTMIKHDFISCLFTLQSLDLFSVNYSK